MAEKPAETSKIRRWGQGGINSVELGGGRSVLGHDDSKDMGLSTREAHRQIHDLRFLALGRDVDPKLRVAGRDPLFGLEPACRTLLEEQPSFLGESKWLQENLIVVGGDCHDSLR